MRKIKPIKAIDLFCGAGGLTYGLKKAGIDVKAGIDIDKACEYAYRNNNRAKFILKPVEKLRAAEIKKYLDGSDYTLLAGCAPCQPFSLLRLGKSDETDKRWNLLKHFQRLAIQLSPTFITMENVPRLIEQQNFRSFKTALTRAGYYVYTNIVNCALYGVPQNRDRLVLLASKLGSISLIPPTHKHRPQTVRHSIAGLAPLSAGEANAKDPLHFSAGLSPLNLKRIRASVPGGTWRDWPKRLIATCHKRTSGKTYPAVYGRMNWDEPSPTITTQYHGFGNGRFGHPEQDRAISLREGAILQSFPKSYQFIEPGYPVEFRKIGKLVGNSVPVKLAQAIGQSFIKHLDEMR